VPRTPKPKALLRRPVDRVLDLADERRRLEEKTSPATKAALRRLAQDYRRAAETDAQLPSVWDTGLRVFSQFDEDGVILFLLAVDGFRTRRFVDLGAGDGVIASNCANLAFNLGYHGLFVDAREAEVDRGRRFYASHPDTRERPPTFVNGFVTRENVNELVGSRGFEGEIDLLSIDLDGNDYWIWESLRCVRPRLVVIETHTELGYEDYVMPYEADFDWRRAPPGARIGASPAAMNRLADQLGYRPVGANLYGFNVIYGRRDVAPQAPAIGLEDLFRHGSYAAGVGPEGARSSPE
jgi:hypothetical protein